MDPTTRRRGCPPEGRLVAVRLEPRVVALLDRQAELRGTTRARVLRDIVVGAVTVPVDGVDRSQIQRMLRLSPAERISHLTDVVRELRRFKGAAADAR